MEKNVSKEVESMVKAIEQIIEKDKSKTNEYLLFQRNEIARLRKLKNRLEKNEAAGRKEIAKIKQEMIEAGIVDQEMKLTAEYSCKR